MDEHDSTPEQIMPAQRASVHLLAIRRRWWLVVTGAVIAGALAFLISSLEEKRYDASAKVLLTNAEPINVLLHSPAGSSLDAERVLNTDVALVKLDSVASRVRAQLKLPLTATQLLKEIRVAPQGTTNLVAITARDVSPTRARAIANAFAIRYIQVRRNQAQSAYREAALLAQRQLASLTPVQLQGVEGEALRKQLQQLQTAGALQTGGAQLVDPASVPTSAASPRPKFAAAVGVFIGLLLGALAAIGTGVTDRRRLTALEAVPVAATSRHGAVRDSEERERLEHPFPAQPQRTRAVRD